MTASDLRFALRRLRRHRSTSLAGVLTLALGVGAVTALYSVVQAVLLRRGMKRHRRKEPGQVTLETYW